MKTVNNFPKIAAALVVILCGLPAADKDCQTHLSMAQIHQLEECSRSLFTELELSEVKNKLLTSDRS